MSELIPWLLERGIFLTGEGLNLPGELKFEAPISLMPCSLNTIEMGAYSSISGQSRIAHCRIGRYCSIGDEVKIGLSSHPMTWLSSNPFPYFSLMPGQLAWSTPYQYVNTPNKTCIGDDVWIGARTIIVGGITIGTGAIIAAGAVVTKDVPPYAIVGGNSENYQIPF